MCATQINHLVHDGTISLYSILRVEEFITNTLGSGAKICILLGVTAVGPNPGEKIGNPVDIAKIPGGGPPLPQSGGGAMCPRMAAAVLEEVEASRTGATITATLMAVVLVLVEGMPIASVVEEGQYLHHPLYVPLAPVSPSPPSRV
jgi:hypothetical protein